MASWYTIVDREFVRPETAKLMLENIYLVAELESIPKTAKWSASIRGIGVIVFAEW